MIILCIRVEVFRYFPKLRDVAFTQPNKSGHDGVYFSHRSSSPWTFVCEQVNGSDSVVVKNKCVRHRFESDEKGDGSEKERRAVGINRWEKLMSPESAALWAGK